MNAYLIFLLSLCGLKYSKFKDKTKRKIKLVLGKGFDVLHHDLHDNAFIHVPYAVGENTITTLIIAKEFRS